MTLRTELWPIATTQYGFVTTQDARELGFSAVELAKLAPREKLERVSHGFYRFPELPHTERDDYMRAVLATGAPDAILSHDTALLVHDLCDINPDTIHVNVGNTRVRRNIAGVQLHGEIPDHGRIRPHNAVVVRHDRSARAGVLPRLVCPAQGPVEHRALASDGRRSGDHSRSVQPEVTITTERRDAMTAKKNFWITGGALLVLGVVAAVIGGQATSAEMDAIDAAGPGGPAGTWLSLGGIATIACFLLSVAGITVLVVGIVRAARAKDTVVQSD